MCRKWKVNPNKHFYLFGFLQKVMQITSQLNHKILKILCCNFNTDYCRNLNLKVYSVVLLYLWLGLGDAGQEEEVSHEEADAEVEVDGGASPLDGATELEGEDAEDEAQQGDGQANLGDQLQAKGVLGEERSRINDLSSS